MKISLFCFWLCWFLAERAFFLVTATGSNSQIMAHRLTAGLLLLQVMVSPGCSGFGSCLITT